MYYIPMIPERQWCTSEKFKIVKGQKGNFHRNRAVNTMQNVGNASEACIGREECNGDARPTILQREYMHAHGCFGPLEFSLCLENTAFSRLIFDSQRTLSISQHPAAPHAQQSVRRSSVTWAMERAELDRSVH